MSNRRELIGHGSFAIALFCGCVMTPFSTLLVMPLVHVLERFLGQSVMTAYIACALPFFCCGFCAGGIFEADLRAVRSRFFPLVFVSPATPVWIFAVAALLYGVEFPPWLYSLILIACISAVVGSLTGYRITRWSYTFANGALAEPPAGPGGGFRGAGLPVVSNRP